MKPIVIEPANPQWADAFLKIKEYVWPHIQDIAVAVIHIGSTSVPGLAAKPILDINIVFESYDVFPELVKRLERLGYEHDGDGGLPMRERFIGGKRDTFMDYNMYASPLESRILLAQVLFSDYLRRHSDICDEYAALKRVLAEKHRDDLVAYFNGKHEFIMGVVNLAMKEKKEKIETLSGNTGRMGDASILDRLALRHRAFIEEYNPG